MFSEKQLMFTGSTVFTDFNPNSERALMAQVRFQSSQNVNVYGQIHVTRTEDNFKIPEPYHLFDPAPSLAPKARPFRWATENGAGNLAAQGKTAWMILSMVLWPYCLCSSGFQTFAIHPIVVV